MRKQKPQAGLFYKLARKTSEAVGSPIASIAEELSELQQDFSKLGDRSHPKFSI